MPIWTRASAWAWLWIWTGPPPERWTEEGCHPCWAARGGGDGFARVRPEPGHGTGQNVDQLSVVGAVGMLIARRITVPFRAQFVGDCSAHSKIHPSCQPPCSMIIRQLPDPSGVPDTSPMSMTVAIPIPIRDAQRAVGSPGTSWTPKRGVVRTLLAAGRSGQGTYLCSHHPFRDRQLVLRLQVQPELGIHAKPMAKPKGAVSSHRTLTGQNLADAIGWHVNLPGETRRRYSPLLQFISQNIPRMYGSFQHCRQHPLSDIPQSQRPTVRPGPQANRIRCATDD